MHVIKSYIQLKTLKNLSNIQSVRSISIKPKGIFSSGSKNKKNLPPYSHFVQIGDPVLRAKCDPIHPKDIGSDQIQSVIEAMKYVLKRYDGVGVSAPQVGIPLQIIMIQLTAKQLNCWTEDMQKKREMEIIPLTTIINPKLSVIDSEKISHTESCCSMHGFSALVPRSRKVNLRGLNQQGSDVQLTLSGWGARIAQHEVDHLSGQMFVDRAPIESLSFDYWNIVNSRAGEFRLNFEGIKEGPRKWFTSGSFLKQG